jgi:hypothetical protein
VQETVRMVEKARRSAAAQGREPVQ